MWLNDVLESYGNKHVPCGRGLGKTLLVSKHSVEPKNCGISSVPIRYILITFNPMCTVGSLSVAGVQIAQRDQPASAAVVHIESAAMDIQLLNLVSALKKKVSVLENETVALEKKQKQLEDTIAEMANEMKTLRSQVS